MKTIKTGRGDVLVDDEDYGYLSQFSWRASRDHDRQTRYAVRWSCASHKMRKEIQMHREILGLTDPKQKVDHINGNRLDNRRENLRVVTDSQNHMNRVKSWGSSKYKGVMRSKVGKPWRAMIGRDLQSYHLGCFTDEVDAALAYDMAAIEMFGQYARPNFLQLRD